MILHLEVMSVKPQTSKFVKGGVPFTKIKILESLDPCYY